MTVSSATTLIDRQTAARERMREIDQSPEAAGKERLPFLLACRFDLPVMRVRQLLADAPDFAGLPDLVAWVEAIPTRPPLKIVR
ncbi:hypothetical protein MKL09_08830 [Methylobacterium sp. J-048]|uniref:hypothetical protein n=1 Tax=Methylobacterium sp. J-048 TaxID=2836635 RepID=UPI001FB86202|nr:hypothetical protein [Methylobacterium sp. J-048]MCJ2056658.1 hypothetical protein [Methylobacterium sp. J-048]